VPRPSALLSRIEAVLVALQLALVLALALACFVLGPKVRALIHETGRPLSTDVRVVLSYAWWPAWLAVVLACTAVAFAASSAKARRGALAAGILLSAAALGTSASILGSQTQLQSLIRAGNPLAAPESPHAPRQMDPDR
jgi:hypothetical protein